MHLPAAWARRIDRSLCHLLLAGTRTVNLGRNPFLVPRAALDAAPSLAAAESGDPAALLAQPPLMPAMQFSWRRAGRFGVLEGYRFTSHHRPLGAGGAGADAALALADQHEARGLVWRREGAHGALIFLHGWCAPHLPLYDWALRLRAVCARAGLDLYFPRHPYHAERTPPGSRFPGSFYLGRDLLRTIEAMRMSLHETRCLLAWCRVRYRRVALGGVSLGGWTAGLTAALEPAVAAAALIVPLVSIADSLFAAPFRPMRRALARPDPRLAPADARRLAEVLDLRRLAPPPPSPRVLLMPATGDTHIPAALSASLHEAWGRPELAWLHAGHLTFPWADGLARRFWDFVLARTTADLAPGGAHAGTPPASRCGYAAGAAGASRFPRAARRRSTSR